ncbi:MAG: four helix bundle protein [Clostridiales bacterium]|nr:four helix bundle protein [Clostridiales bacterium]
MKESIIQQKSFAFAIRIVNLYRYLAEEKKEHIISKQLMRSGTGIGANIAESLRGASKKDFSNKMNIALKEANESEYWLELLRATEYLDEAQYKSMIEDCAEINKMLIAIVRTSNKTG